MTTEPAPDSEISRSDIISRAKEAFSFLTGEGFTKLETEDRNLFTTLAYISPEITIEVEMEWRDEIASVLVCRTVDGKPSPGWIVHEGQHVRDYLGAALEGGNDDDRAAEARLREAAGGSGPRAMLRHLSVSASVLRDTLPSIRARLDEIFAYPLPEEHRRGVPGFDY